MWKANLHFKVLNARNALYLHAIYPGTDYVCDYRYCSILEKVKDADGKSAVPGEGLPNRPWFSYIKELRENLPTIIKKEADEAAAREKIRRMTTEDVDSVTKYSNLALSMLIDRANEYQANIKQIYRGGGPNFDDSGFYSDLRDRRRAILELAREKCPEIKFSSALYTMFPVDEQRHKLVHMFREVKDYIITDVDTVKRCAKAFVFTPRTTKFIMLSYTPDYVLDVDRAIVSTTQFSLKDIGKNAKAQLKSAEEKIKKLSPAAKFGKSLKDGASALGKAKAANAEELKKDRKSVV